MKSWKPENPPSNRDRLELYALHKQAISGDAPVSFPTDSSVAEKARYQAWKAKRGLTADEAMAAYAAECDRQVRVYGSAAASVPQTPTTTPNPAPNNNHGTDDIAPRGIAAIPLLCAAAAESRVAYLRRLSRAQHTATTTGITNAWWSRQEPLCGTPGAISSLPEAFLLSIATFVEYLSLHSTQVLPFPPSVVQSFLWPLHNISLAAWMLLILILTFISSAASLATTVLWGSRRTGQSLPRIWAEGVQPAATAVHALCQPHQPISVRLVGLLLLPYPAIVQGFCDGFVEPTLKSSLMTSLVYVSAMLLSWWYWILVIPWIEAGIYVVAFWSGFCFALIDLAGV